MQKSGSDMALERRNKECEWKDGDRGGSAEWEQTHGRRKQKCILTPTGLLMEGVRAVRSTMCSGSRFLNADEIDMSLGPISIPRGFLEQDGFGIAAKWKK